MFDLKNTTTPPHPSENPGFLLPFPLGMEGRPQQEKEKKERVWRERLAGGPDLWAPQNAGEGLCLTTPQPALHESLYCVFSVVACLNQPIGLEGQRHGEFHVLVNMTSTRVPRTGPRRSRRPRQGPSGALSAAAGGSLSCPPCSPRSPGAEQPVCLKPPGAPHQSRQAEPVT